MKKICVAKANPISEQIIEDAEIHIKGDCSIDIEDCKTTTDITTYYKGEASKIMDGLRTNLPQGTMHQLLILMLKNHEHLLVYNSK